MNGSPRTYLILVMLLLFPAVVSARSQVEPRSNPWPVAVLDFASDLAWMPELGPQLGDLMTTFLSNDGALVLVERAELERILDEQELGLSGTVDSEAAATLGRLTGAKFLVTGHTFVIDDELIIVAKVMSTETGRVFGEAVFTDADASPAPAAEALAGRIASTLRARGSELAGAAPAHDDPIARLAARYQGTALPTVSVHIRERHAGGRAFAPAAEGELSRLLQRIGFTLVDSRRTGSTADVRIEGQATSEFTARQGTLVTCRGSVEIQAVDRKSGAVLAVDRQSELSVDLAERAASQAAIERSTAKIVERLCDKLVASR